MSSTAPTIGSLIFKLRHGELLIPNFQRPFVWAPEKWQSFFASCLLDYPLGILLIGVKANSHTMSINEPISIPADKLKSTYAQRAGVDADKLDNYDSLLPTQVLAKGDPYNCWLLLDGQQRLSALDLLFSQAYHSIHKEKIGNDRFRWFLDLSALGLKELAWPDLRQWSHDEACDAVVGLRYIKSDKKRTPFHLDIEKTNENRLLQFCNPDDSGRSDIEPHLGGERLGLLLPLDRVISENPKDKSLEYDHDFLFRL